MPEEKEKPLEELTKYLAFNCHSDKTSQYDLQEVLRRTIRAYDSGAKQEDIRKIFDDYLTRCHPGSDPRG